MTDETQEVLCGTCRVPIEGPENGTDESVFSCPSCGRADTKKNVVEEVQAFVTDLVQRSLVDTMKSATQGNKFVTFKSKPLPNKTYRFVTNHKF